MEIEDIIKNFPCKDEKNHIVNTPCITCCRTAFPDKLYDVIVLDPPWQYYRSRCKTFKGVVPYPTMSLDDIKALPIPDVANIDCACVIWCTGPHIPSVFTLFDAWGFHYKTVFLVWNKVDKAGKPKLGPGFYTRPSIEYLFLGVKGSVLKHKQSASCRQYLSTIPRGHSVKPDEAFDIIETFFGPKTEKLECFARTRHLFYDAWGLEVPQYFHPWRKYSTIEED